MHKLMFCKQICQRDFPRWVAEFQTSSRCTHKCKHQHCCRYCGCWQSKNSSPCPADGWYSCTSYALPAPPGAQPGACLWRCPVQPAMSPSPSRYRPSMHSLTWPEFEPLLAAVADSLDTRNLGTKTVMDLQVSWASFMQCAYVTFQGSNIQTWAHKDVCVRYSL